MKKMRYEIDPHNRLVIEETGRGTSIPHFRRVLDGRFKIGKDNRLIYHIKSPLPYDANIPHQVKLKGEWSLTENHDLRLTFDKWGRQTFGDQLTLQGDIIGVDKNSLLFAVTTKTKEGAQSTYILKLEGSWQADKTNRLTFRVNKESGTYDILTLNGIWEINKNHQIVYQYEKAYLARKRKKVHALSFKGYWDIKDKARISYILDKSTDSSFNFRTSLGIFKDDYIKYDIGIGISQKEKPIKRTLTLFGTWQVKKNVGLIFEVGYENKKTHAIMFGADARLTDKDTVLFRLKNDIENKDIGITLELSHKILKGDGEAFLRVLKSKRGSAVSAGAAWRW